MTELSREDENCYLCYSILGGENSVCPNYKPTQVGDCYNALIIDEDLEKLDEGKEELTFENIARKIYEEMK